ncbi:MAG: hypothetical protein DHS20C19_12880 [Acidimicrobiales bacterium]|nr:MAG: hypothetical protein DHS20C19_12880 [Acidimicrobiales bacterium]
MTGITVTRAGERLLAVKRASPGEEDRRRREATLLQRLDHPGVVQFVDLFEDPELELRLDYAGTDTWARTPPTTAAAVIEGLAAVTSTVADLHEMGTAHGSLAPDHVIVGPDRRPVLCGLADAASADEGTRAEDVAALADLIDTVAAAGPDDLRTGLASAAAGARDNGLSARQLTAELNRLRPGRAARVLRPRPRPSPRTAAAVALASVAIGALTLALWPRGAAPAPVELAPAAPATSTSVAGQDVATTAPPSDAVRAAEPTVLVHEGRRFALGSADDEVVMGDWDCDGEPTPAVLVRATGEIARFGQWPEPGGSVFADDITTVPDAVALAVIAGETCDRLRIIRSAGSSFFPEDS